MTEEVHKLGEVLRTAREAKGVDLAKVERDTKIRERYLSALERGEYHDLPGSVYTRGFLRNYGAYLGLEPEYLVDLYRLETTAVAERPRAPTPPRAIATRRSRTFIVTPEAVVAALLVVGVGAFIAYLGYEFINFARQPELRVIEPAANVLAHTEDTITIRGITEPNARVTITGLRENPSTVADDQGSFEIRVGLVPGSNVIRLTAFDPVTRRESAEQTRTVRVVSDVAVNPSPGVTGMTLDQPAADASVTGPVTVSGRTAGGAVVLVTPMRVEAAAPSFTVSDAAGTAVEIDPASGAVPEPLSLTADASGAFSGSLALAPGSWDVTVATSAAPPVSRRVTVQAGEGLVGTLELVNGESWLEVDEDGTPLDGASGDIRSEGESIGLRANGQLRIRAGNAAAVQLTVNGIGLGVMGADGAVIEWRITRSGD